MTPERRPFWRRDAPDPACLRFRCRSLVGAKSRAGAIRSSPGWRDPRRQRGTSLPGHAALPAYLETTVRAVLWARRAHRRPACRVENPALASSRSCAFQRGRQTHFPAHRAPTRRSIRRATGTRCLDRRHVVSRAAWSSAPHLHPAGTASCGTALGSDCLIYPNVVIREFTEIGDRVILQLASSSAGRLRVQTGARRRSRCRRSATSCSRTRRGRLDQLYRSCDDGETRVRRGTKIDNLVQIAHNVEIARTAWCAPRSAFRAAARRQPRQARGASGHAATSASATTRGWAPRAASPNRCRRRPACRAIRPCSTTGDAQYAALARLPEALDALQRFPSVWPRRVARREGT